MSKLVFSKSAAGEYSFSLTAPSGRTVFSSTPCEAESKVAQALEAAKDPTHFERCTSSSGNPYFVLRNEEGQVLGHSALFPAEPMREHTIREVQAAAVEAVLPAKTKL